MEIMSDLKVTVFAEIARIIGNPAIEVTDDTPLIGDGSVLDSMKLVEVCLALEEAANDQGFEFDWTTEAAMSRSRSIFRTAAALADEFARQKGAQA